MGGELVTEPASSQPSYGERFKEVFPYYLSIGMTEHQYWDADCTLVCAYRKADKLRTDRINQILWWQGAYTYQVMGEVSPLFRMSFSKKSVKAEPYLKEPFPINGENHKHEIDQIVENERLKATLYFKNWARANRNAGR